MSVSASCFPASARMQRIASSGHADRRRSIVCKLDRPATQNNGNSEQGEGLSSQVYPHEQLACPSRPQKYFITSHFGLDKPAMQPVKGLLVHTLRLEPFFFAQAVPQLFHFALCPVPVASELAPIFEAVAMSAQKELACTRQNGNTPPASRTQKPWPPAAVVAPGPVHGNLLFHVL